MQNTAFDTLDAIEAHEGNKPLSLPEYKAIIDEIDNQPREWRRIADKEMDYADGNQLDTELLAAQKKLGIPPSMENVIAPALEGIRGFEVKTRTDWRVSAVGQPGSQDVADAVNFKLNEAESKSGADDACSAAFYPQIAVGLGWVEASKSDDPFDYPYQCNAVHRNEIDFPWDAKDDMSDARWLRRQRWLQPERVARAFPTHRDLVVSFGKAGVNWWSEYSGLEAGGSSTGLSHAADVARSWTTMENRWWNPYNKEVCLSELWYRRWMHAVVLKAPDGRVIEYDGNNPAHVYAVANNRVQFVRAPVSRIRRSYWLGPHCLFDGPTPYAHRYFPYVPFWGFREDSTRVPFGYVRNMLFQQDTLNSGNSRLRWGMSAIRTERTKGAVDMPDDVFRRTVGRLDADIVLNPAHMAQAGARFEVIRDFQLNAQQLEMLNNSRQAIERVNPAAAAAFSGRRGTATSGVQEETQVEQANQALAYMMSNAKKGRTRLGEILSSMIVQDMGTNQHQVVIEGDSLRPTRVVVLNRPEVDPETGIPYLSNDLQRTMLKVSMEDVPSSSSFRAQQLRMLTENTKSLPPHLQAAATPFLVSLMDVPFKKEMVEAMRAAASQESPEQVEQRIKQAVADALAKAGNELKARELDMKERKTEAEIKQIMAQAVQVGVQAAFSAMQGGAQIAMNPLIAPIADEIMKGAGYQPPTPGGVDPNFPVPAMPAPVQDAAAQALPGVQANTSPAFPPVPQGAEQGMTGIETTTPTDNLGAPA